MIASAFYIPKDGKDGEDAHFIAAGGRLIGVADGVGGTRKQNIDSGIFARQLMDESAALVRRRGLSDPVEVIDRALAKTTAPGSATACVLSLKGKWLHAAVLGDSGFAIVRDKVIYQSPTQQFTFNGPYRLDKLQPNYSPLDALRIAVAVKKGDLVVLATDGLFDNMHQEELEELIAGSRRNGNESPEALARLIALEALRLSRPLKSTERLSPFFLNWLDDPVKENLVKPEGKPDDITVVVARVK